MPDTLKAEIDALEGALDAGEATAEFLRDLLRRLKTLPDYDAALAIIAEWPANAESDPDVAGEALELSQTLANKTRLGVPLNYAKITARLKAAAEIDRETDDDGERDLIEREVRNLILHPLNQ